MSQKTGIDDNSSSISSSRSRNASSTYHPAPSLTPTHTSPSKRPRSPESNAALAPGGAPGALIYGQPPLKTSSSPSTRETSQFITQHQLQQYQLQQQQPQPQPQLQLQPEHYPPSARTLQQHQVRGVVVSDRPAGTGTSASTETSTSTSPPRLDDQARRHSRQLSNRIFGGGAQVLSSSSNGSASPSTPLDGGSSVSVGASGIKRRSRGSGSSNTMSSSHLIGTPHGYSTAGSHSGSTTSGGFVSSASSYDGMSSGKGSANGFVGIDGPPLPASSTAAYFSHPSASASASPSSLVNNVSSSHTGPLSPSSSSSATVTSQTAPHPHHPHHPSSHPYAAGLGVNTSHYPGPASYNGSLHQAPQYSGAPVTYDSSRAQTSSQSKYQVPQQQQQYYAQISTAPHLASSQPYSYLGSTPQSVGASIGATTGYGSSSSPNPTAGQQTSYHQPLHHHTTTASAPVPAPAPALHHASSTVPSAYSSPGSSHITPYASHHPMPHIQPYGRRSITAQSVASAGGSSYQSGVSPTPSGQHRRSDDMEASFLSQHAVGTAIPGGAYVEGALANAPITHPIPSGSNVVSPPAPVHGMVATTTVVDPSMEPHPGYYSIPVNVQDYQSIVDEIMAQSRKGTDFGLDLGDFEMLDTLGTGTFGRVLLVKLAPKPGSPALASLPPGLPTHFAMKVLTKVEVVRLKQVEHINCERSILGAVDHPGIVNLFCTFQDSLNIYMLLEFVQGGELFSHLRRSVRFTADVTRFYAANIILVLEYLHNRNLIYRDLKPENLLLDTSGYLKVTDFGFAKYVPDRTFTLCGTPEYLAPEIINSAGHGKAADWWAFGVLLFEMLCGYPPFFDESPWGIYEKILAGNFSFPAHVDPVARDLIRRLLSSDRSKRLGHLRGGAMDVKNHQWFEGVDWSAVEHRLIPAPIIPRIKSNGDSQNFERYPNIPLESLPGLAKAKGVVVKEEPDIYEDLFTNF